MEYVCGGKLLTFLREHKTQGTYYNFSTDPEALTSRDIAVFMYCVARGMEYLATKKVIHTLYIFPIYTEFSHFNIS